MAKSGRSPRRKINSIGRREINPDFQCGHCGQFVSADPYLSGVQNRNHCPICLWSRHVDFQEAGDRLSSCRGMMKPIGVTYKKIRKKYGPEQGELMLIHQCSECGGVSINRIAADDDIEQIQQVFRHGHKLPTEIVEELAEDEILVLGPEDEKTVKTQLFGRDGDESGAAEK